MQKRRGEKSGQRAYGKVRTGRCAFEGVSRVGDQKSTGPRRLAGAFSRDWNVGADAVYAHSIGVSAMAGGPVSRARAVIRAMARH